MIACGRLRAGRNGRSREVLSGADIESWARAYVGWTLDRSMAVLRPVLPKVFDSATQPDVKMPLRPYHRIGRSVPCTPSLPTSDDVVMYVGFTGSAAFFVRLKLEAGSASSVKRKGIGVAFWNEVSCPDGQADGSSLDCILLNTSCGGSMTCPPMTELSNRRR